MVLRLEYYARTDQGHVRQNNEDTFIAQQLWDETHILIAAIDGMGGADGGEIAAEVARTTIIKHLQDFHESGMLDCIKNAVAAANNEIFNQRSIQPKYSGMGCVATAGIFDLDAQTLYVAHVGDSRLYRFSHCELSKLTHDHSLVGYQEENGILSEEQAMRHPRRSVIERCLGAETHLAEDPSFIEATAFPLMHGETFIFCSDGLCDMVTSVGIIGCLNDNLTAEQECNNLVEEALEKGGKDNVTVIVAKVIDDSQKDGKLETEAQREIEYKNQVLSDEGVKEPIKPKKKYSILWAILALAVVGIVGFLIGSYYNNGPDATEITEKSTPNAEEPAKATENTSTTVIKDSIHIEQHIEQQDSINLSSKQ